MFLYRPNIVDLNDLIVRCLKLRLIIPNIENILLILSFMWSLDESFSSNRIPRSFIWSVRASGLD